MIKLLYNAGGDVDAQAMREVLLSLPLVTFHLNFKRKPWVKVWPIFFGREKETQVPRACALFAHSSINYSCWQACVLGTCLFVFLPLFVIVCVFVLFVYLSAMAYVEIIERRTGQPTKAPFQVLSGEEYNFGR